MARRKKEEVVEETKVMEPVEMKQPEIKATVKRATKKKSSIKITAPRVNVRKSPSLMGEVKKIAVAGEKFELLNDSDNGFYEVVCDNENACIMKDYAELV